MGLPPYGPEPYASANSATPAWIYILAKVLLRFKNFLERILPQGDADLGGLTGHAYESVAGAQMVFCPLRQALCRRSLSG